MVASGDFVDHRSHATKINPLLLPVCCPRFLKRAGLLGWSDPESSERQDHRTNADVRLRALANMPTLWAPKNCRANVPVGSNSLQHRVQVIAQLDDCVEGHALMPLGAQPLNHLRKPYSLCVTGGHV